MGYGRVLREKYSAIRFLVEAQKTVWYPILFAVICMISGSFGSQVYIPLIVVLCSFVLFSVFFADDNKVFLVPMLMIYYSLGRDNLSVTPGTGDDLLNSSFDKNGFIFIIVCGVIVTLAFVARMIADGSIARAFRQRRIGAIGIVALDIALMLNGIFNPNYTPMNILYGFIIAISFTLFYFATSGMLEGSKDFIPYACKCMVCTAYVALGQFAVIIVRLWQNDNLFRYNSSGAFWGLNRYGFVLAWGLSTAIAGVFVLGVAASLYLARNCKYSVVSYGSAILFLLGTVIINTRSAMLVGAAAFIVGSVLCCLKNAKHKKNAIVCRIMFAVCIIAGGAVMAKLLSIDNALERLLELMRLEDFDNSPRLNLWKRGWTDFLSMPIFGVGFDSGSNISNNVFSSMYHCIIFQFLGSMGILGAIAALVHFLTLGHICFKNAHIDKFLLLLLPFMIIGMSMVDNFFFYPNFQIFYCIFIVLAEYYDNQTEHPETNSIPA